MPDQDASEARVVEPLAKFHAKVTRGGQFTFPLYTRLYHNLDVGDYVELIIRTKVDGEVLRGMFIARLVDKGNITIPKGLRSEMKIDQNSIIEVIVVRAYRLKDLLGDKAKFIRQLALKKYKILT
ncbi:predicted transcription regulator, SpoVT/AbrB family [Thermococcus kodakarensis KOD1]|uniref:Predicted transcription regulator, SpoVT/AbrB family n=1 Tax=Thermococcus kodakarensis (strain ATCC BAA-918 / JCM 12380 / KOD1) TaxID=69014 RepID=Q5JG83_THEKO|nr:AbrB/MazE/SpoVT family DNA-binding domain-containing protein [Thermococcus kodakarensis]WCN28473.1 AbrB/MazE/SpoVT family DNA-binding domain-containing protein [Thermococcus kodakarensis]WCN30769.1 AbrB/MazE/SpoVT family DNA-binding domain-containing protein [Thermococcus kodakarensis]BAD84591.1 predicted transcription regulator, SpoVT/AbrB family [Thermococcus kodakarensis KOD1]